MSNDKNIDEILNGRIKNSLLKQTRKNFSDDVMKQIMLSQQFAKEDKKENKVLIYLTGGISLFIVSFLVIFGIANSGTETKTNQTLNIFENFSNLLKENFSALYEKLNLSFSIEYIIIALTIIGFILMSNFADKIIFRKR
ncbi:MAG TPA: hypothetical protein DEP28_02720 [Bacteroidetes bacterium]|nr:hypothetical protein [Bacteroidota bacterium]